MCLICVSMVQPWVQGLLHSANVFFEIANLETEGTSIDGIFLSQIIGEDDDFFIR